MFGENSQLIGQNFATKFQLDKLQNQYRNSKMRNTKDEMDYKLMKQKRVIDILSRERSQLVQEIEILKSRRNLTKSKKDAVQIKSLMDEHEQLQQRLKNGKAEINDLNREIFQVQKQVHLLNLKEARTNDVRDNFDSEHNRMAGLENRLEVETQAMNKLITRNELLRHQVQHYMLKRDTFLKSWQSLTDDLSNGKKYLMELLDFILEAYEERDEWGNKLEIMKTKDVNGKAAYEIEINALKRDLDNELVLYEFLDVKTQQRFMVNYEQKKELMEQESKKEFEMQIQNYETIIKQIQEFSDECDIDRLCAQFMKREEENFALFKYINEQNNEIVKLKKSIKQLADLIEKEKESNFMIEDTQKSELKQLQSELDQLDRKSAQTNSELKEMNDKIDKLLDEIEKMFVILDCNKGPIKLLLGDNDHVTTFNVGLYLGLIEKSIMDLIFNGYCLYKDKSKYIDFEEVQGDKINLRPMMTDSTMTSHEQLCSRCLIQEKLNDIIDDNEVIKDRADILENLQVRINRPDIQKALHHESVCQLPPLKKIGGF